MQERKARLTLWSKQNAEFLVMGAVLLALLAICSVALNLNSPFLNGDGTVVVQDSQGAAPETGN